MKRVLIDALGIKSHPTGLSAFCIAMLRELIRRNNFGDVTFLIDSDFNPIEFGLQFPKNAKVLKSNVGVLGFRRELFFVSHYFWIKRNFDTYLCLSSYLPLLVNKKTKCFVVIHDLKYLDLPQLLVWPKQWLLAKLIKRSLKRATRIFAVSSFTRERIRSFIDKPVDVILEALPMKHNFAPSTGGEFLLSIGEDRPHKNLLFLVDCFCSEQLSSRKIVLVGKGTKKFDNFRGNPNVVGLGKISDVELKLLLEKAIALVFPSKYEGFGLPVLEANVFGKAVLYYEGSCLSETAGDSGIPFNNLDSLQSGIQEIEHDFIKWSNRAKENLSRFSWQKTVSILLEGIDHENR